MPTKSSAELRLTFSHPRLMLRDNHTERVAADAQLVFALNGITVTRCERFPFVAPLGLLEADDIKWYLESYYIWPVGLFKERAERIEQHFPVWGEKLLATLITIPSAQTTFRQWLDASAEHEPVISLHVPTEDTPEARTAASRLLGFPWELLRNGTQYLLAHTPPVRIRRNLPNPIAQTAIHYAQDQQVIRILALSPRPEQAGYIDHRASIKPLVETVKWLGKRAELVRVNPATFEGLEAALQRAKVAGKPFHVLHFDGHGVFDVKRGKGALCFESPLDEDKLVPDIIDLVYTDKLAALLTEFPLPLVFLEACQTGQSEAEKQEHTDPNASVAAALLQSGVASVIAMSHSVLVETARRFVSAFYQQLAEGQRIGSAVLAGRQALMQSTDRINIAGAGTLQMQDWFVPVLYQREDDPRLFSHALQLPDETEPKWLLGDLPETPKHTFIGRSRELLKLERLLDRQPYAVIRGMGGIGKTAVAVELARWLVQCRRFERCAFVSVETYTHERAIVDILGKQLVDEKYSVAEYGDNLDAALQPIIQILQTQRTLLVIDNMESLLADVGNTEPVLALADTLLKSSPQTRLLFTTREPLPAPFNGKACDIELGALSVTDAKALVMQVMNNEGLSLRHDDQGNTPQEVDDLVRSVGCHARALVLLARELAQRGLKATTANVRAIMQELEQRHPGQRELSLFTSVELSLRRLSPEIREQIAGLSVFKNGGYYESMAYVVGVGIENIAYIIKALIQVGLAQTISEYHYIRLDPALPSYLSLSLTQKQQQYYQERWLEAVNRLTVLLYLQRFSNAKFSAQITLLELPNLMAYLQFYLPHTNEEQPAIEDFLSRLNIVDRLIRKLTHSHALQEITKWQKQFARNLNKWSTAYFENECLNIDALLQKGLSEDALIAVRSLLEIYQQENKIDNEVSYDLTMLYFLLGRTLISCGHIIESFLYLDKAQAYFEQLAVNDKSASRMISKVLVEHGDALQALGRLDESEIIYNKAIKHSENLNDIRQVGVAKVQLSTTLLYQGKHNKALQGYSDAKALFEGIGEILEVANSWHLIGMAYRELKDYIKSEDAYKQSLSCNIQIKNIGGEMNNLIELGNLCITQNHYERAQIFFQDAVKLTVRLKDKIKEGLARNNLGYVLYRLGYYKDARTEIECAIICNQGFGFASAPWDTLSILHDLEKINGNYVAAQTAKQQAINLFLAYRQDGGENHSYVGILCKNIKDFIYQDNKKDAQKLIDIELADESWGEQICFIKKLQAILYGHSNLALENDEQLNYESIVELLVLRNDLKSIGI
ncbi:CHAT domain-containing protein [Thiothrix sp.]|uniref:CHAT domain-containing protein n=1 Tax=Thiothrix sp. TaxID=1032 RepID=UPI00257C9671|nr:CHAT domain-containing protein [Thiothrix sp.]